MALLALDLGVKRTGVALSTSGQLVTPIGVWPTQPWSGFVEQLRSLVETETVTTVVVGDNQLTDPSGQSLIGKLTASCPVPVVTISEWETTNEAQQLTGLTNHADATAAVLILERYLESLPA